MMTELFKRLLRGESLREEQMSEAVGVIMDGEASEAQIAALLVALRMKGETVEEITGAARAMRKRMTAVPVKRKDLLDTCGTGGDGAGTFNVSTAVAFVAAAGGVGVAKHGNRAVSSRSGSADVLQELGVNISASAEVVGHCVDTVGIGFLFAQTMHPAMKYAAPIRRQLGVRTIFNVLGPLTNPAGAGRQLLGVFDRNLVAPLAAVLGRLGCERAWVVHGADGLDELSVCDASYVAEWDGERVVERTLVPEEVGLERSFPEGLHGGTAKENAGIMRELLAGERQGALRDIVALNAGAALHVAGVSEDLRTGVQRAGEIMAQGSARSLLDRLIAASNGLETD